MFPDNSVHLRNIESLQIEIQSLPDRLRHDWLLGWHDLVLHSLHSSINQSCIDRMVQVIKSLQDPLEVGNDLQGISDNVREWDLEQKCF